MKTFFFICVFFLCTSMASAQKANAVAPVVLKSGDLLVKIDPASGLPCQYIYKKALIRGMDSAHLLQVVICRLHPRSYITLSVGPSGIHTARTGADVKYVVHFQNQLAASFKLKYTIDGSSVVITMEEVKEENGFELIETNLPDLAAVREEDGPSWLAHGIDGGRAGRPQKIACLSFAG